MKKFWRGFRKESDLREREEQKERRAEVLDRIRTLMIAGGHDGENEFRQLLKEIDPQISKEKMAERIRQYHDAVNARQSHDRGYL
jgi:hypothetical protein